MGSLRASTVTSHRQTERIRTRDSSVTPDAPKRPPASSEGARLRMQRTRRRDTPRELALRRILHRWGLRFRVDAQPLANVRRRADLVFSRAKLAVYVDGCFWHSCPIHGTQPKANKEWWAEKLAQNVRRDRETDASLRSSGWEVVRVWEHEPSETAAARVASAYRSRVTAGNQKIATSSN